MSNYNKVKGRIVEVFGTQEQFAKALEVTPQTVTNKLNGKSIFSTNDILKWCDVLGIEQKDINVYFFA